MARTREKDHFGIMFPDDPAQVGIEKGKAGARTPMAEQAALDMFGFEGFPQKGIACR